MHKQIIITFNGLFTLIIGDGVLTSQLFTTMATYNKWIVGIGCIIFGILGIYYSGLFQGAFARKKVSKSRN